MGDFVTLWIGERLGAVERACLKSMVRHGRGVKLFCYAEPANVPDGVTLRDASSIIALDRLKSKCGDRSDLYSDWFRYLLLRNDEGTWLDTDVYVLKEIDEGRPYLFGKQQFPDSINGAVLRLPAQSPILSQLIDQFDNITQAVQTGQLLTAICMFLSRLLLWSFFSIFICLHSLFLQLLGIRTLLSPHAVTG